MRWNLKCAIRSYVSGSLLVAIQVAGGQYTPRSPRTGPSMDTTSFPKTARLRISPTRRGWAGPLACGP
jgi:hypothetical protein